MKALSKGFGEELSQDAQEHDWVVGLGGGVVALSRFGDDDTQGVFEGGWPGAFVYDSVIEGGDSSSNFIVTKHHFEVAPRDVVSTRS